MFSNTFSLIKWHHSKWYLTNITAYQGCARRLRMWILCHRAAEPDTIIHNKWQKWNRKCSLSVFVVKIACLYHTGWTQWSISRMQLIAGQWPRANHNHFNFPSSTYTEPLVIIMPTDSRPSADTVSFYFIFFINRHNAICKVRYILPIISGYI